MTGNVVFLGFALAGDSSVSAGRSLTALAAFAAGGLAGGRFANALTESPIRAVRAGVCLETLLLTVAAVLAAYGPYAAIVLTSLAMGVRNACVRKAGVPDLTTTVLTLTVTGLAADSRLAGGLAPRLARRVASILAMGAGAWIGGSLERRFGVGVPLLAAASVGLAIAFALSSSESPHAAVSV
jgi:uncharacterized membrane protein YoaK (UPF0700 family)